MQTRQDILRAFAAPLTLASCGLPFTGAYGHTPVSGNDGGLALPAGTFTMEKMRDAGCGGGMTSEIGAPSTRAYGVRLRHDACGGSPATMNAISIQAIPSGDNRQGGACRAPFPLIAGVSGTQLPDCTNAAILGATIGPLYCGTAGCR